MTDEIEIVYLLDERVTPPLRVFVGVRAATPRERAACVNQLVVRVSDNVRVDHGQSSRSGD